MHWNGSLTISVYNVRSCKKLRPWNFLTNTQSTRFSYDDTFNLARFQAKGRCRKLCSCCIYFVWTEPETIVAHTFALIHVHAQTFNSPYLLHSFSVFYTPHESSMYMEHVRWQMSRKSKGGSSSRLKLTWGPKVVVPTKGVLIFSCIYMASKEYIVTLRGQKSNW